MRCKSIFLQIVQAFAKPKSILPIASGGGEEPLNVPPPEVGKIVVETGVIFQWYILSEKRQKCQKYLVKIRGMSIFYEIFIKESHNFLKTFHNFLRFWSKPCRILQADFLFFAAWWKLIVKFWLSRIPLQITIDFVEFFINF